MQPQVTEVWAVIHDDSGNNELVSVHATREGARRKVEANYPGCEWVVDGDDREYIPLPHGCLSIEREPLQP